MNKKYYWLRLKDDFFSLTTTKLLRKMPEGDKLTIIYLKLQLLSLKTNGALTHHKLLPNLADELAVSIDEDIQYVSLTLSTLERLHLIEPVNGDEYLLTAMNDIIGAETKSAKQKREYRKRIGQIKDNKQTLIGHNSDINRTMSDRDREEIEKNKIKRKVKEDKKPNENVTIFFEHIKKISNAQIRLTDDRAKDINSILALGYNIDQLKDAYTNFCNNAFIIKTGQQLKLTYFKRDIEQFMFANQLLKVSQTTREQLFDLTNKVYEGEL